MASDVTPPVGPYRVEQVYSFPVFSAETNGKFQHRIVGPTALAQRWNDPSRQEAEILCALLNGAFLEGVLASYANARDVALAAVDRAVAASGYG